MGRKIRYVQNSIKDYPTNFNYLFLSKKNLSFAKMGIAANYHEKTFALKITDLEG
jgi:hypothetical protein